MTAATLNRMSKKPPKSDRHKPRRMVGVPDRICQVLELLGREEEAPLSEMVKRACIEYARTRGKWPPPAGK